MLNRLSYEDITSRNFEPVAAIDAAPEWFQSTMGLWFDRDADDLDDFEIAAFEIPDVGAFALLGYKGTSKETSLMFDDALRTGGGHDLSAVITRIAEELGVPLSLFHWRDNGEEVSLMANPLEARRQESKAA